MDWGDQPNWSGGSRSCCDVIRRRGSEVVAPNDERIYGCLVLFDVYASFLAQTVKYFFGSS
jgi:hypothetical protein